VVFFMNPDSSPRGSRLGTLRLKFRMQHSEPFGHRMLRWTYEASTTVYLTANQTKALPEIPYMRTIRRHQ
jgi:hypothetical protein